MAWEVEAALRKMKNGKEAGKDQVNIETLKAGDETIAKQLAKLYTKCITERRIPKTWKEANVVIFFKKRNRKYIKNYRPICLLSNMNKLFTQIITTRLEKKLDENQPREQAGLRSKYSTTDHIHATRRFTEAGSKVVFTLDPVLFRILANRTRRVDLASDVHSHYKRLTRRERYVSTSPCTHCVCFATGCNPITCT